MSSSSPKTWALTHGHTHTDRANKGDEPKHWRKIDEVVSVWLLTLKAMWIRANMLLFSFKHNGWMYFNGNGSRRQHSKPLIFVWQTLCLVTTCFVCAIHASFDGPFFFIVISVFFSFFAFFDYISMVKQVHKASILDHPLFKCTSKSNYTKFIWSSLKIG